MRYIAIAILLLVCVAPAFAQTDIDTASITITTSRSANLQPDQIVLTVRVTTGFKADLNEVLKALQPAGVTMDNFVDVNGDDHSLFWQFSVPVTVPKVASTIAALTMLEKSLTESGFVLTVSSGGSQVSPELQAARKCATAELMADAEAQAQKLATAAGVVVGPIIAVSDGSLGFSFDETGSAAPFGSGPFQPIIGAPAYRQPSQLIQSLLTTPRGLAPQGCSAVVKFRLYR